MLQDPESDSQFSADPCGSVSTTLLKTCPYRSYRLGTGVKHDNYKGRIMVWEGSLILRLRHLQTAFRCGVLNPGSNKIIKRRGKIFWGPTFYCSHKFHIIENYRTLFLLKEIFFRLLRKNLCIFNPKVFNKPSELDLVSGIRKKLIPDP